MTRVFHTVDDLAGDEGRLALRTGLAFLLAPGIAAIADAAVLVTALDGDAWGLGACAWSALLLAVFGYVVELILAAPIYMALPRRARGAAVVVSLAGSVATLPWLLIPRALHGPYLDLDTGLTAFGLGCLGGVAFVLIRGPVRSAARDEQT